MKWAPRPMSQGSAVSKYLYVDAGAKMWYNGEGDTFGWPAKINMPAQFWPASSSKMMHIPKKTNNDANNYCWYCKENPPRNSANNINKAKVKVKHYSHSFPLCFGFLNRLSGITRVTQYPWGNSRLCAWKTSVQVFGCCFAFLLIFHPSLSIVLYHRNCYKSSTILLQFC